MPQTITFRSENPRIIEIFTNIFITQSISSDSDIESVFNTINPNIGEFLRVGSTIDSGFDWLKDYPKLIDEIKYVIGCDPDDFKGNYRAWLGFEQLSYEEVFNIWESGFSHEGDQCELYLLTNPYAAVAMKQVLLMLGCTDVKLVELDQREANQSDEQDDSDIDDMFD